MTKALVRDRHLDLFAKMGVGSIESTMPSPKSGSVRNELRRG